MASFPNPGSFRYSARSMRKVSMEKGLPSAVFPVSGTMAGTRTVVNFRAGACGDMKEYMPSSQERLGTM